MFGLSPMELVIIFLVILLVFGAKRIPEIAQGIGKGINEFKKAAREVTNEIDSVKSSATYVPPAQPKAQAQPLQVSQPQTVRNDLKEETKVENSPQQSVQG